MPCRHQLCPNGAVIEDGDNVDREIHGAAAIRVAKHGSYPTVGVIRPGLGQS